MDYRTFGEHFVYCAVTPERVVDAVRRIAGDEVVLGPIKAGPGGRATVNARGRIGEPLADETGADPLSYGVELPVDVSLEVKAGTTGRFDARGRVRLHLSVRVEEPLVLVIDVAQASPGDVEFDIEAHGVQSKLLGRAGDVGGELRRHTAAYVNERIAGPDTARYTRIELLPLIDEFWGRM